MSEKQYYRDLLLRVQDKIRSLGATNRNRWAAFCYGRSMTIDEFSEKMKKYNLTFQGNDLNVLWNSIGIEGDMTFTEFLKFMQTDVDDFVPVVSTRRTYANEEPSDLPPLQKAYETPNYDNKFDRSPYGGNSNYDQSPYNAGGNTSYDYAKPVRGSDYSPNYGGYGNDRFNDDDRFGGDKYAAPSSGSLSNSSASDLIHENLRDIVIGCMSKDLLITGEVSKSAFIDVCTKYGVPESSFGFNKIITVGDPTMSGLIQYFTVAAHVCQNAQNALPPLDTGANNFRSEQKYSYEPPRDTYESNVSNYEPKPVSPKNYRNQVDFNSPTGPADGIRKASSRSDDVRQRKLAYESSISFGETPDPPQLVKTAIQDHNIFGAPEPYKAPQSPARAVQSPQNFYQAPPAQNYYQSPNSAPRENPDDVLMKIGQVVAGKSTLLFNKWRGYNTRMTAADLQKGLLREYDMNISIETIQEICDRYGGELNLSGFVKLMADGASMQPAAKGRATYTGSSRKMTEDDQTIDDIARQFSGQDFESIVAKARNADDLCIIFSRCGINFDEARVKKLVAKQGKNGFVDAIALKLGQI